jgi:hypothetical protein
MWISMKLADALPGSDWATRAEWWQRCAAGTRMEWERVIHHVVDLLRLQGISVVFQPAHAAFNLAQIWRSGKIVFPTALFRAIKPLAQFFKNVRKHDVLRYLECGFPRIGEGVVAAASTGSGALASRCVSLVEAAGLVDGLNRIGRKWAENEAL